MRLVVMAVAVVFELLRKKQSKMLALRSLAIFVVLVSNHCFKHTVMLQNSKAGFLILNNLFLNLIPYTVGLGNQKC